MVVKQANITSYKVSDPSDILDRRPVMVQRHLNINDLFCHYCFLVTKLIIRIY